MKKSASLAVLAALLSFGHSEMAFAKSDPCAVQAPGQVDRLACEAAKGNKTAMRLLGLRYETGQGVEKSFKEAKRLFSMAIKDGPMPAPVAIPAKTPDGRAVEIQFQAYNGVDFEAQAELDRLVKTDEAEPYPDDGETWERILLDGPAAVLADKGDAFTALKADICIGATGAVDPSRLRVAGTTGAVNLDAAIVERLRGRAWPGQFKAAKIDGKPVTACFVADLQIDMRDAFEEKRLCAGDLSGDFERRKCEAFKKDQREIHRLGLLYEMGDGVQKDLDRALTLYRAAENGFRAYVVYDLPGLGRGAGADFIPLGRKDEIAKVGVKRVKHRIKDAKTAVAGEAHTLSFTVKGEKGFQDLVNKDYWKMPFGVTPGTAVKMKYCTAADGMVDPINSKIEASSEIWGLDNQVFNSLLEGKFDEFFVAASDKDGKFIPGCMDLTATIEPEKKKR